jgi:hypothetical protein
MSHIRSHETAKNPQKSKEKNYQELYDRYIRKGDEAIITEDIISAEKYYQHADYYLRCLNDPNHCGTIPKMQPSTSSPPVEELIAKALKGIAAERAARKEALLKQAREAAKASKAARKKKKKARATCQEQTDQGKAAGSKERADKKARNEPCNVILLNSKAPYVEFEKQNES